MDCEANFVESRATLNFVIDEKTDKILTKKFTIGGLGNSSKWQIFITISNKATNIELKVYLASLDHPSICHPAYVRFGILNNEGLEKIAKYLCYNFNGGEIRGLQNSLLKPKRNSGDQVVSIFVQMRVYHNEDISPDLTIPIFLKEKRFSDIYFKVGDKGVKAHKFILSVTSPVLQNIAYERFKAYIVNDMNFQTVKGMLDFIYGLEIKDFENNAVNLLYAAEKYQITKLRSICLKYLSEHKSFQTIFVMSAKASTLKEEDIQFILSNIKVAANHHHFEAFFAQFYSQLYPLLKLKVFELEDKMKEFYRIRLDKTGIPDNELYNEVNNDFEKLLRDEHNLADVVFDVAGKQFKAHRLVLLARWPSIINYLSGFPPGSVIPIHDVDPDTFYTILKYVYCGKLHNLRTNALKLSKAANILAMPKLQSVCEESMVYAINDDNFVDYLIAMTNTQYSNFFHCAVMRYLSSNLHLLNSSKWDNLAAENPAIAIKIISGWLRSH